MKKILAVFMICLFSAGVSSSAPTIDDPAQFQANNPDGNKYEFAKTYINALVQLKNNAKRQETVAKLLYQQFDNPENVQIALNKIVKDNVNLRIARNLMLKFRTPENGLMLKVADLFAKACDQQIAANVLEKKLLEEYQKMLLKRRATEQFKNSFSAQMEEAANARKEAYKDLLEASLLAAKVLISNKTDKSGNFVYLGFSAEERKKLISLLDQFYGQQFQGVLREGQTFLQGSISALREVLEDRSLKPVK